MSGVPDGNLGACLTAQIQSVRAKLIALEALAYLHGATEEAAKAIRNFRNETEGPSRRRNNIIHNPIYGSGEDAELKLGLLTLDKKLVKTDEKLDPNQLAAFLNEIGVLIGKFSVLMNTHVLPLRPASAGKPQMPPIQTPPSPSGRSKSISAAAPASIISGVISIFSSTGLSVAFVASELGYVKCITPLISKSSVPEPGSAAYFGTSSPPERARHQRRRRIGRTTLRR